MRTPILSLAVLALVAVGCAASSSSGPAGAPGASSVPQHHLPTAAPWPPPKSTPYGGVTYDDPG